MSCITTEKQDTHCNRIRHKHDHYDHKETGYVTPGSLQCSSDHVHLGVQSEQVPQFDGGEQDQEGDQILEQWVCSGCFIETGKSMYTVKKNRRNALNCIMISKGEWEGSLKWGRWKNENVIIFPHLSMEWHLLQEVSLVFIVPFTVQWCRPWPTIKFPCGTEYYLPASTFS